MDLEFWVSAVRDLALLLLGGGLTLLGSWMSARNSARENEKARVHEANERRLNRDDARADERRSEDALRGKELLGVIAKFEDYIERDDEDERFPDELIAAADDLGVLIHDADGRKVITEGVQLIYCWGLLQRAGRGFEIESSQYEHRWTTYRALRNAAGALARQDPIPEPDRTWLLRNIDELDAAWKDQRIEQEDWQRANAEE